MSQKPEREVISEINEAIDHLGSAMRWAAASKNYEAYTDGIANAVDALEGVVYQIAQDHYGVSGEELDQMIDEEADEDA